ncbi:type I-C CRISPR-associated endonuclease Cas1 [Roseospira marina]|uniref:CRISPR-associated endonuclease Cas1 n=1 Tax=Roseospira marina TaxID=140057 RepID=A0A5M6IEY6_9PROT|nr:type I-C CRISPR-associated endonuclease Cas1c [Roseospira marina]KAA5606844.1 type I-C CRISPR-associated endonuclease Cas1 [Roseospira marina]MBB4312992.1 CRISPR-associated protein Cas1 [Roseospira marina]MBB5086234.1 CRISPR-associated protein Cas1 [Roseospira marina]
MKQLLNTLYVTTPGTGLRKDGETVLIEREDSLPGRIPMHMLGSLVVFGGVWISPPLIEACASGGITIVLLNRQGRFQARIEGPVSGNVLLRRAQYKASESAVGTGIVQAIVAGKIANQRAVLMRTLRDRPEAGSDADTEAGSALRPATERLADILRRLRRPDQDIDALRGLEGEAGQVYFAVFDHLLRTDTDPVLRFHGRSRRPPRDATNALLSFLYTLLVHDCRAALESVGLDPAVGFLHRDRPGRPSLALDLMEELRPILADRLALSLINRRQIQGSDIRALDGGAVLLTDDARKTVLTAWQERKRESRRHPFLGESAPIGLVPFLQAQMLARHLRGDLDAYPPWLWK